MIGEFRVRASQSGYYMACAHRAALDKQRVDSGAGPRVEAPSFATKYAAFGTCVHWYMQEKIGCAFPPDTDSHDGDVGCHRDNALVHKYTNTHVAQASDLVKKSEDILDKVRKVGDFAASRMPDSPEGAHWLAETGWRTAEFSGHIDFLSSDLSTIIDLKTTTKPPPGGKIKPEHYYQLLTYALLVGPTVTEARILYVHTHGDWSILSDPVDFTTPEMKVALLGSASYLGSLASGATSTPPLMSSSCGTTYCPYDCQAMLLPVSPRRTDSDESDLFTGVVPLWLKK